jgi:hypothetical protein
MATAQASLTPIADTKPVVVSVTKELSGAVWVSRYLTSTSVDDCVASFKTGLTSFIAALKAAGVTPDIAATFRPFERAYLMHWSWMIVNKATVPKTIPSMTGVNIEWDHGDSTKSTQAAQSMVDDYRMRNLRRAPALNSRHTEGKAVDMSISWTGDLSIKNKDGTTAKITSSPKDGMNADLKTVGATYDVMKVVGGDADKPHWSTDGH